MCNKNVAYNKVNTIIVHVTYLPVFPTLFLHLHPFSFTHFHFPSTTSLLLPLYPPPPNSPPYFYPGLSVHPTEAFNLTTLPMVTHDQWSLMTSCHSQPVFTHNQWSLATSGHSNQWSLTTSGHSLTTSGHSNQWSLTTSGHSQPLVTHSQPVVTRNQWSLATSGHSQPVVIQPHSRPVVTHDQWSLTTSGHSRPVVIQTSGHSQPVVTHKGLVDGHLICLHSDRCATFLSGQLASTTWPVDVRGGGWGLVFCGHLAPVHPRLPLRGHQLQVILRLWTDKVSM